MKTLNDFMVFSERTMTTKEKSKEDRLKDKYDDSDMKNNMKDQYGEEEGEKVYYATIRKQAMKKEEVEVDEGVIDAVKKGAKRHAKAIEKKKIKNRKAVPYAALAAEHEPEGEMVEGNQKDKKKKEEEEQEDPRSMRTKYSIMKNKLRAMGLNLSHEPEGEMVDEAIGAIAAGAAKVAGKAAVTGAKFAGKTAAYLGKKAGNRIGKELVKATSDVDNNADKEFDKVKVKRYKETPVKEDYMSGQTGKIQKRTLAWMRKKGMKGAPGLDAMKAREAEHKAKRGVKEEAGCETKKIENKGKKKIDPNKNPVVEARVDKGRSDYGKATIRNWRHSGPSTVEPAMFDPENKRGKTIEKRREEHKARRGKKGAKVPTYKKESFSDWRTDLGEEGYDRMRDDRLVKYGIGHDGSDRKAGSSKRTPDNQKIKGKTVLQKETEKKYGKGVSALDVVKKQIQDKYGKGAVMDTKKPKK